MAYSQEVERSIEVIGKTLDLMAASSMDLLIVADIDIRDRIRELNSRLVSEVVLLRDRQTSEEATDKLLQIGREVSELERIFSSNGVPISGPPSVPTDPSVAVISKDQASELLELFKSVNVPLVDLSARWSAVREIPVRIATTPETLKAAEDEVLRQEGRLRELDRESIPVLEAFHRLEAEILPASTDSVQIARNAWDRMRRWISLMQESIAAIEKYELASRRRGLGTKTMLVAGGALAVSAAMILLVATEG